MKKNIAILILLFLVSCSNQEEKESITISAASSMIEVLDHLVEEYNKQNDVKVTVNYAGSGVLQRQIEKGAPVDLYISASIKPMEELISQQMIKTDSLVKIAENSIVLISPKSLNIPQLSIQSLLNSNIKKIAIGNPQTAPVGQYAKQILLEHNVWEGIESKLIFGNNVRQVLTFVERGEVDIGFVYASDLKSSEHVIGKSIPKSVQPDVSYYAAVVNKSTNEQEARKLLEFIMSNKGKLLFEEYMFERP